MSALEKPSIPDKLFFRIQEAATLTGVKPYVLRYWETEFPMLAPEKDADQRRYRRADLDLVFEIKRLLYDEQFTIAGARRQLRLVSPSARRISPPVAARPATPDPATMAPGPVEVDLGGPRRIRAGLAELRRDVAALYKSLG